MYLLKEATRRWNVAGSGSVHYRVWDDRGFVVSLRVNGGEAQHADGSGVKSERILLVRPRKLLSRSCCWPTIDRSSFLGSLQRYGHGNAIGHQPLYFGTPHFPLHATLIPKRPTHYHLHVVRRTRQAHLKIHHLPSYPLPPLQNPASKGLLRELHHLVLGTAKRP